jgi:hypothetical protein
VDHASIRASGFFDLVLGRLLRTLAPGTMGGDQGGIFFLFSMLAVTLGGIFVVSLLIGVLTNGVKTSWKAPRVVHKSSTGVPSF